MKLKVKKFPSPFGVRVLKCPTRCSVIARRRGVSVPFRGSCSEMMRSLSALADTRRVSVPFRGSCSEIARRGRVLGESPSAFPSPFGVRVLKISDEARAALAGLHVSVPFRGSCSEMPGKITNPRVSIFQFPSPFGVRVLKSSACKP